MRYVENPPNPYDRYSAEFLGEPPETKLEVFEETTTRSMIVKSFSPDFGKRFVVNCYRGCIHACTYCFARQYHEFIGFGAGTDFETKIVVKVNAPEVLRRELSRTRNKIPCLEFSFASDPYLPLEAGYELTRDCLRVCREYGMPATILTKSPLVTRDIGILREMDATVAFSIPFLSVATSRPFEPYVPTPEARFRAMRTVADAGINVGLALAPVIPGYNDAEIPAILETARENGATRAFMSLVHFETDSVREYFVEKLKANLPGKHSKIIRKLKREKGGSLLHAGVRGRTGEGEMIRNIFDLHTRRLGFEKFERQEEAHGEPAEVQPSLF